MFFVTQPFFVKTGPVGGRFAVCRLDANRSYERDLTETERSQYLKLRSPMRRAEWLASRIAMKRLVLTAGLIRSPLECEIQKGRLGRPIVRTHRSMDEGLDINCSISHKGMTAAVCLSTFPELFVGIDIETISLKAWRVRKAFVNPCDSVSRGNGQAHIYTVLWSCKEAAAKAVGFGLLMDVKKLSVMETGSGAFDVLQEGKAVMQGEYFLLGDSVIALCHLHRPGLPEG